MAHFHPNKGGNIYNCLNQVEATLAELKLKAAAEEEAKEPKNLKHCRDAQTSTTSLCPAFETSARVNSRNTSVLIRRSSSAHSTSSRGLLLHRNAATEQKFQEQPKYDNTKIRTKQSKTHGSKCNAQRSMGCPASQVPLRKSKSCDRDCSSGRKKDHTKHGDPLHILKPANSLQDMRDFSMVPPLSQSSPRENETHWIIGYSNSRNSDRDASHTMNDLAPRGFSKERRHVPPSLKLTVPLPDKDYAKPTLSHRLRVKLTEPKKESKENNNMMHFIPSGESGKSHHIGVIVQKKLGILKQYPPNELFLQAESLNEPANSGLTDDESLVSESAVRAALCNIQTHLDQTERLSSKH